VHPELGSIGEGDRALDRVLQLANVTGPWEGLKLRHRITRDREVHALPLVAALGRFLEELLHERGNVLGAFSKRWQVDLNDAHTVVEVFTKCAVVDHLAEVAIRRGDDTHVDGDHARATDALHLPRFEHAQELGLKADVELADLIQEQRAAIGHLEAPLLAVGGASERAAFVTEQYAFDEIGRDGAAVLNDERSLRAFGRAMNGAGDELLAGAGFPANEHGQVGCSNLLENRKNLAHSHAVPDEIIEFLAPAEVDLDRPGAVLETDDGVPDPQRHARFQPCFADAHAGNPGAATRTEVAEEEARFFGDDLAVRPAHLIVGELEVTDAAAADGHPLASNVEALSFLGTVFDDEAALAKLALGRFAIDEYCSQRMVVVHSASFRIASMAAA